MASTTDQTMGQQQEPAGSEPAAAAGAALHGFTDRLARQDGLDGAATQLQKAIGALFNAGGDAGRRLNNVLHGLWLGHPLHPALTDVPVGAWTAAIVLDALDIFSDDEDGRLGTAADAALAIGLAAAVPTALSGMADYEHADGAAKRIGLVHALLNVGATALYTASLLLRRAGARGPGRALAFLTYGGMMLSAYLGGRMVYTDQLGVDHTTGQAPPEEWTAVLADAALPENQPKRAEAGSARVLLVRQHGRIHALNETCAHLGGPLSEGKLEDGCITCPWHGSRYDLETGRPLDGPSPFPQPRYETRVRDGQIEVRTRQG